jgi:hypothetical protein
MGEAGPGRLEFRTERNHEQDWQALDAGNHLFEQLDRSRVEPMCVLKNHENRLLRRQALELGDERRERSRFLRLRTEVERWIAAAVVDREQ